MPRRSCQISLHLPASLGGSGLRGQAGNAVIEFVVAALGLQLLLLAATTSIANQIDSQTAADVVARQSLRARQLETPIDQFEVQLTQLAQTLGLSRSNLSVTNSGDCSTLVSVTVQVRNAKEVLSAPCN